MQECEREGPGSMWEVVGVAVVVSQVRNGLMRCRATNYSFLISNKFVSRHIIVCVRAVNVLQIDIATLGISHNRSSRAMSTI